ncbi:MAG: YifB family Mg chelatase-like AAA ATPase [Elusimicrobia bacterium]|nr:YifB family Mg chelatase-like AAA ATPase [Elusimicrobiota bacterium]
MLSKVWSAAVRGIEGFLVGVELDLANGLPTFTTVGLPDSSVREARDRVVSAVRNSGFEFPSRRVTVNLAPAELRKGGTQFDLPIGLGALIASEQVSPRGPATEMCFLGELALDGSVRAVSGVLPMAASARQRGLKGVVVPRANLREASAVPGIEAYGVSSLREAAELLGGAQAEENGKGDGNNNSLHDENEDGKFQPLSDYGLDLCDVRGQLLARRALEIAAAGGHNLLMMGPPGTGKSMLARRLVGILPPLTPDEALEVTRIYSVCGLLGSGAGLMRMRPFRAPHHTATTQALIGGGGKCRPGEATLSHCGVLFMDEWPEFGRDALEALRQPLEDKRITVSRLRESVVYPADFMLVAAMNPCPCGYLGHPKKRCRCSEPDIRRYRGAVSGPMLDRMDMQVELAALPFGEWRGARAKGPAEPSEVIRGRVQKARLFAAARPEGKAPNSRLSPAEARQACHLDPEGWALLETLAQRHCLSPRSLDRLLRVARTVADMEESGHVERGHLAEAAGFLGKWEVL